MTTPSSATGADERDDRTLMKAHVDGDPDAFNELVRRHRDRLWAVALRTLSDPEEAADAVQDALISAFRRADSYRGDAAVTTWLHRIVVNACLDRMRRQQARPAVPLPDDVEGRREVATTRDAHDDALISLDIQRALATLAPEQRAALVLVDVLGHSVDDAAKILDCPVGTVKSRCARGRAKLLPLLEHLRNRDGSGRVESRSADEAGGPRASRSADSSPTQPSTPPAAPSGGDPT